jgi:7-cyano-7-deazaguanine reductase
MKKYGERAIKGIKLEAWDNPYPRRDYKIEISFPEFTCLCPRSGYPDFATFIINYIPNKRIIELKSLKLYLNSYRNQYISHEAVTNKIYDDLNKLLKPHFMEVIGDFNERGNVKTVIKVTSEQQSNSEKK